MTTAHENTPKGSVWFPKDAKGTPRRWPSGHVRYRGKVIWPNKKRQDVAVPEKHCYSEDRAAEYVRWLQEQINEGGDAALVATAPPAECAGETWNEWHSRYLDVHASLGKLTREMRGSARKWVSSRIGSTAILEITRQQIVAVRDALTAAVLAGEISAKRSMNVWSDIVVAPFSRAFTDDDPRYSAIRVGPANANPAMGIKPPVMKEQLDEEKRERQPLYPHEFLMLLASADVPVEWKRIYVIATFLYLRPQELYALRWTDVNWEAEEIRIRRKLNVRTGEEIPGTKSDAGIREVPIHPNLMPLLRAMHDKRVSDDARIIPLVGSARLFERFADQTRRHLQAAGIKRSELVSGTPDLMPFDFRSFRTTGCTWLAMLGTDSYVIASQAGHKDPDTTWASYIKSGPDLRKRHGEPFPALPEALLAVSTSVSTAPLYAALDHVIDTSAAPTTTAKIDVTMSDLATHAALLGSNPALSAEFLRAFVIVSAAPAKTPLARGRRGVVVSPLYCWRCKRVVPMVNDEEYASLWPHYDAALRHAKATLRGVRRCTSRLTV